MATRILLATTSRWIATARLAAAFSELGCHIEAVCRSRHPLTHVPSIARIHPRDSALPNRSIERAIRAAKPDLIVSTDEPTLRHLQGLLQTAAPEIRALIEHSIGDAATLDTALARSALIRIAVQQGVLTPATAEVNSPGDVTEQIARLGLPLVLKADASAGGQGVRVLTHPGQAASFFRNLRGPVSLPRVANRILTDRDWRPGLAYLRRSTTIVNAQQFVAGGEGNVAVSCWRGEVLACLCFEVVTSWCVRGPSSVLRVVDNPVMTAAARKLIRRLNFSGFAGFDFIFSQDGTPLLLEMNARPTQTAHLCLGPGQDLVAAFLSAVSGHPVPDRPAATSNPLIALFPQEWQRDPASPMLTRAFHDVPWTLPDLVREGINTRSTPAAWEASEKFAARFKSGLRAAAPAPRP